MLLAQSCAHHPFGNKPTTDTQTERGRQPPPAGEEALCWVRCEQERAAGNGGELLLNRVWMAPAARLLS